MNTMVRERTLNKAFKRFQRLPELRGARVNKQEGTESVGETPPTSPGLGPEIKAEEERCTDWLSA